MKIIIFRNILFITLYILSYSQDLRKIEEIQNPQNIEALLKILPSIFDKLTTSFFKSQCTYSNKLTYKYFKNIESNTNIKYYLDIKENQIPEVIDDILLLLKISDNHYKNLYKFIDNFLSSLNDGDNYKDLDWLNQIFTSIDKDKNDKIPYGNLFVTKKGNKIDIILCFGLIGFNSLPLENGYLDYMEYSKINDGFIGESFVSYINSLDLSERGDRAFMTFLRLAGLKSLGNKYGVDIPYPRFNGFY